MRLLDKIISWSLYAAVIGIIIFALGANFLIIVQAIFSPLSVVQGNSMSPVIKTGDAVYITSADSSRLSVGDIVVFNDPENPRRSIVHRVVGLEESDGSVYAVTRGDANAVNDPFMIPVNRVSGKVGMILPKAGLFLSFLSTPSGFILCVLCPFGVLLLYLMVKWRLEKAGTGASFLTRELIRGSRT